MAHRVGGEGDGGPPEQGESGSRSSPFESEARGGPVRAPQGRGGLRLRHRGVDPRTDRDGHPEGRPRPVPSRACVVCASRDGILLPDPRAAGEGTERSGHPPLGAHGLATHPKKGCRTHARLAFWDESGVSDRPTVRRTWSLRGRTPIIQSAGHWRTRSVVGVILCTVEGRRPALLLRIVQGTVRSPDVVRVLTELRRHTRGTVILLWDRLAAHRSREVQASLRTQRSWLSVETFPAYAPELNPPEYLWSALTRKDLANVSPDTPEDLDARIRRGVRRVRRQPDVRTGCLRASTLFGTQASR